MAATAASRRSSTGTSSTTRCCARSRRIVHEADLGDERYDAPEAPGLDAIAARPLAVANDEQLLDDAAPLFDALYESGNGLLRQEPPKGDGMKWVTSERPKTDRIACPWLIRNVHRSGGGVPLRAGRRGAGRRRARGRALVRRARGQLHAPRRTLLVRGAGRRARHRRPGRRPAGADRARGRRRRGSRRDAAVARPARRRRGVPSARARRPPPAGARRCRSTTRSTPGARREVDAGA